MIIVKDKSKCSGCHACENSCPQNCISMIQDEEGFLYPQVDTDICVDCGLCEKVCPIIEKWQPDGSRKTTAWAAINLTDKIRLNSSSGGVFTLIAEKIIDDLGGVVFGAAFSEDFRTVRHIWVDNTDDLKMLRGSKYVQSRIDDAYQQAKKFLDSGRKVLFTGTPCQIGGLYSYLRKPYDNLYTQDIICHGVPSPMVWKKYVEEREQKASSKTQQMSFRYKKYGWKSYAILFEFANNTAYERIINRDPFMKAFLSNVCLRPSCYECTFKSTIRQSDITLADFWGVWNVFPDMYDDRGTSAILIHSSKGQELLDAVNSNMKSVSVGVETVKKYNPAVDSSVVLTKNRRVFFNTIKEYRLDISVKKVCGTSLINRIVKRILKIVHAH